MLKGVRSKFATAGMRSRRHHGLPGVLLLSALTLSVSVLATCATLPTAGSTAQAQPAGKAPLRAKVKAAAEELNKIASAAPDKIRSMFAGTTPSAELLALDERSMVAQTELETAIAAANAGGALSADESKELARLGDLARKTRPPVKDDIDTLKSVLALPLIGGDTLVRQAPQSQQDAVISNAEAAKRAVAALVAAIRKLP